MRTKVTILEPESIFIGLKLPCSFRFFFNRRECDLYPVVINFGGPFIFYGICRQVEGFLRSLVAEPGPSGVLRKLLKVFVLS